MEQSNDVKNLQKIWWPVNGVHFFYDLAAAYLDVWPVFFHIRRLKQPIIDEISF